MTADLLNKITILYEDKDIMAIDKPAGLVVHSDGKTAEPSVSDWIVKKYPELVSVGEPWESPDGALIPRPGIVHRIDRETSGVLVICKNQKSFEKMKSKFKDREVEKSYYAFVYGEMKDTRGTINRPITRSRKDFRLWSAQRGGRGEEREAVTDYVVLERGNGFTFVEARPKTGRTHQIRVHFKAINYPVVCDRLYAPKREAALGFGRLALHAAKISFEFGGKQIIIESPLPADFKLALKAISQ
jgi:23S rRNA pseudouridine1911/1915/1917 synthase